MLNRHSFLFLWRQIRYYLIFLVALCFSLGVPGCGSSPPSTQTSSSSPQPISTPATTTNSTSPRFDGITVNFLSVDVSIGDTIKSHISNFESQTGAKINLIRIPVNDLYNTLLKDWSSAVPKYDATVAISQWAGDFAKASYIEDLGQRVGADTTLQWQDVAPFFQKFSATYQGRIYAIPLDGDFHMAYYRQDLLEQAKLEPPTTWEEYIAIAKRFHGQDLNGDGQPDYGSCIDIIDQPTKQKSASAFFWSIVSPFIQSQGTAQGAFFDPETMKPFVNNQAFAKALDIAKQVSSYGHPLDSDAVVNKLFVEGRCALAIEWGDIGTMAINPAISKVVDKVGATITPGTTQVLDRKTGKLVACDKFTCPYNIGGVNHAPYAASGGWAGFVNTKANLQVKNTAYAFLSFLSQSSQSDVDVTTGGTGFSPYRISQFNNPQLWIKAGMTSGAASKYLGGISISLNNPNMVLDLRIPNNYQYQAEVLGSAITDFLEDKITTEEAMRQVEQKWEQITNEVGRESQRAAYRASLGLTP